MPYHLFIDLMINEIVLYSFIRELDGSLVKPSPAMGAMYVEKR